VFFTVAEDIAEAAWRLDNLPASAILCLVWKVFNDLTNLTIDRKAAKASEN
jgi:hypothetical protein